MLNLGVALQSSILVCRVIIVFPLYRLLGFIAGYDILNQPDPVWKQQSRLFILWLTLNLGRNYRVMSHWTNWARRLEERFCSLPVQNVAIIHLCCKKSCANGKPFALPLKLCVNMDCLPALAEVSLVKPRKNKHLLKYWQDKGMIHLVQI